MSEPPRPARRGLQGHLRLVCAVDGKGRSFLKEQSFSVPFHLGKSFPENGVLVLNVVNPTAGLFQGDATRMEVRVETGTRLLLTYPSATRVHDTQGGWSETTQDFFIGANGWLEILPELFLPQQGARHRQRTRIEIEPSGELCFLEMLAPGRVASGEVFAFQELDWRTEIRLGPTLLVRERFRISSEQGSLAALRRFGPHPYVATFFLISPRLTPKKDEWQEVDALHTEGLWLGRSQLLTGGWVVKLIAGDSCRLREAVAQVREKIHVLAGWPWPQARKL